MITISCTEMPRERLITHGGDRVSTVELLAVILGTGMRGRNAVAVAEHIIHSVGGVARLAQTAPRELVALPGIGLARAARIVASFQLGRRAMEENAQSAPPIASSEDIYHRVRSRLSGLAQEVFVVLALDARNVVTDAIEVARGSLTHVEVHPREVFRPLIRQAAAAAVVAHNHPSGDPTPSDDDVALTLRLRAAGEIIGIPIIDHLVVGEGRYISLASELS
ncbi:MAG: DNA repair protein RadC [Proteobacteria bacterium]|nr:DNA repair protein RadC [Pseudomonadota bacterium]